VEQILLESLFPREMPWVPNTCQLSICQNHTLRQELNVGKQKCPEKFRPETELTHQVDKKIFDATKKKDLFLSDGKSFHFNGCLFYVQL